MRGLSAALLGALLAIPAPGGPRVTDLPGLVDVSAILRSWKLKGVLFCVHSGRPRKCLWVENAYPCGIVEVVRRPFGSILEGPEPLLKSLSRLGGDLSSSGGSDRGQTNLQFAETRVYSFIPALPDDLELPIAAPRGPFFQWHYVSELDAFGWRTGLMDRVLHLPKAVSCETAPHPQLCAGRWGAYYPREGFLVHHSEPMASMVQALRAGRVASDPAGRFVLSPYPFEPRTGHFLQMVSPVSRPAVHIGQSGPVDEGAGAIDGAYLFIHMGIFEACRRCLPPRLVGVR